MNSDSAAGIHEAARICFLPLDHRDRAVSSRDQEVWQIILQLVLAGPGVVLRIKSMLGVHIREPFIVKSWMVRDKLHTKSFVVCCRLIREAHTLIRSRHAVFVCTPRRGAKQLEASSILQSIRNQSCLR